MEDDIVQRLRDKELLSVEEDGHTHFLPKNPDGDDGADEIIRLRAENEKLEQQVAEFVNRFTEDMFVLRAENEKLREAVSAERERCAKIAEQARDDTCDGPVAWSMADSIAAAIRESGNE